MNFQIWPPVSPDGSAGTALWLCRPLCCRELAGVGAESALGLYYKALHLLTPHRVWLPTIVIVVDHFLDSGAMTSQKGSKTVCRGRSQTQGFAAAMASGGGGRHRYATEPIEIFLADPGRRRVDLLREDLSGCGSES